MHITKTQQLARRLAYSPIFHSARQLLELNLHNMNLPLTKFEKLLVGMHLILIDYSEGHFPPVFADQQKAYDAEIAWRDSPGFNDADVTEGLMRKPFWFGPFLKSYFTSFLSLVESLERVGLHPPQKLLELGCGTGWMAEFLAQMQFDVLGTSISPYDIQDAQLRIQSLEAKRINVKLEYRTAPMETVDKLVHDRAPFDGVFVFEALHHAYNWRQALQACYNCLQPNGWLIIANEPNVLHTFISYRVAKLSNTHEIGFTYNELMRQLIHVGFRNITRLRNSLSFYVRPHWLAAQK